MFITEEQLKKRLANPRNLANRFKNRKEQGETMETPNYQYKVTCARWAGCDVSIDLYVHDGAQLDQAVRRVLAMNPRLEDMAIEVIPQLSEAESRERLKEFVDLQDLAGEQGGW